MTEEETKKQTEDHIAQVQSFLKMVASKLEYRGIVHDRSKFSEKELPFFIKYTPKLKDCTYG